MLDGATKRGASTNPGALDWHDFAVGLPSGPARELALHCTVLEQTRDRLVLGVAAAQHMMATKRVQAQLCAALADTFGWSVQLELRTQGKSVQDSPAARIASKEQRTREKAEHDLLADPGLQALQEGFGARIERVSIEHASAPEKTVG